MVRFDEDTIYSMPELEGMLADIVGMDTFLDRLGLRERRLFKNAVWGWEILEGSRKGKPFSEPIGARPAVSMALFDAPSPRGADGVSGDRLTIDDLDVE